MSQRPAVETPEAAAQALSHSPESLRARVQQALEEAKKQGATDAQVVVSHSVGLDLGVRKGEIETLEHERDQNLSLIAHFGQSKGAASTTDFSEQALLDTVEAACRIARYTEPDPYAGMPSIAFKAVDWQDLDLDHPWELSIAQATELAQRTEQAGFDAESRIENSEGASVNTRRAMAFLGDTQGFMGGYRSTRHSLSCALVARGDDGMQRDYAYSVSRRAADLGIPEDIGREAAERTVRRLGGEKLSTRSCPVLFAPEMARTLIGSFTRAISGPAQFRESSFLLNALDERIFPEWMRIEERPLTPRGLGSAPFDGEGVQTRNRPLVEQGVLRSYTLDSYAARRLGRETTGNAGGARNVTVRPGTLDAPGMLREMGTGLLVTELIGQGVNPVTGDYSRGAAGFWVENGEIVHPVEEITIAGNLKDMFRAIVATGSDVDYRGNIRTGSILIESMTVAGE
ncbi:metalloprotease PmbA [Thioalkalivibrio halophilus]|uniref:Metalloprotease PmbA n=1 Tax=Thioalkalivibrio halophilus TaxID=252474 RepID=A0A1V2ZZ31_9GAMM|nr:metalloprotease PmbA [Thioalkalivibrio halophilus]OOC10367.1 metalloprotease PmbA [Thioalkalivibrio halophilus]